MPITRIAHTGTGITGMTETTTMTETIDGVATATTITRMGTTLEDTETKKVGW